MDNLVILPGEETNFIELARTARGRVFRKKILHMNDEFVYPLPTNPRNKVKVDAGLAESLVRNFKNKVCDIVQVPLVDDKNQHTEDPTRNVGEVIDVDYNDEGVFVTLDARNKNAADEIGNTILGISAMLSTNYTDTKTGEKVGPTLLHTALTNRPFLTDLGDFQEIVKLSADSGGEAPVLLSRSGAETLEEVMTKEEMIAALKEEHGIDVEALLAAQADADKKESVSLSNTDLSTALTDLGVLQLSAGSEEVSLEEIGVAVVTLSDRLGETQEENVTLSARVAELEDEKMGMEIDDLVSKGKILPAKKDAMLKLAKQDRELFDSLLPEGEVVSLSEVGVTIHEAPDSKAQETIARLAEKANNL